MRRREAMTRARRTLADGGIAEAPLEAELLLRHALGIDRAQLYTEPDAVLTPEQADDYQKLLFRRHRGEPSAYITGHREFYGLDFYVNPAVLIPRPETELLVAETIAIARRFPSPTVADIGTGCGAIAISLAWNLPSAVIYATDVSPEALAVAQRNSGRHGVSDRVRLLQGDLLQPLPAPVDIIVANLPYVPRGELERLPDLRCEPGGALDGGTDGTALIAELCRRLPEKLNPGGWALLEIGLGQAEAVARICRETCPAAPVTVLPDGAGIPRVIRFQLTAQAAQC
ncbi:MAG: peptide chain release factor N(5)-glutamine methyltransferase [Chloroflexota bacterium]